jgi:DNA polymerase III subunit beta
MQFEISKKDFLLGLSRASYVITPKVVEPIYSNVVLNATGNELEIIGGSREQTLKTWVPASVKEPGKVALSARRLFDIVRYLPDLNVELATDDHQVTLKCGKSEFKLPLDDAETYPNPPTPNQPQSLTLNRDFLNFIIKRVSFIIPRDDARRKIGGALFELNPEDGMTVVSTDGYRLCKISSKENFQYEGQTEFVITANTLGQIEKLLEDEDQVRIEFERNVAVFYLGKSTLYSLLLDTRFPQYRKIIPTENPIKMTTNRALLIEALKRVSVVSNQLTHEVLFQIENNQLNLYVRTSDLGEATEEINCQYNGDVLFEIAYNSNYLGEILDHVDTESVTFELDDPDHAALIKPDGHDKYLYLIMPLRIDKE